MASSFLFLLSLISCVSICHSDTIAFLDSFQTPYLKTTTPSSVTRSGFDAIISILTNSPSSISIDDSVGQELDRFLMPNVFNRPALIWTLALVGATKEDFGEDWNYVDLKGSQTGDFRSSFLTISEHCRGQCLTEAFQGLSTEIGGSFQTGGSLGLNGQLTYSQCPSMKDKPLSLDSKSVFYWVMELSGLWKELHGMTQIDVNGVIKLETTLTGLYFIRQEFGSDSRELKSALCFTHAAVTSIHASLSHQVKGKVFSSILLHDSSSDVPQVTSWHEALERRSRSLLSKIEGSDVDPNTTPLEKTKSFATNSVGYIMFLIISFSALCSIYALSNMDFTKDTLLYSQAKID
eukprot:g5787.t1